MHIQTNICIKDAWLAQAIDLRDREIDIERERERDAHAHARVRVMRSRYIYGMLGIERLEC